MENKNKPLSEKEFNVGSIDHDEFAYFKEDVKEAVSRAENLIISMKKDDDYTWNMRLNLIIEEFRKNIFGSFE